MDTILDDHSITAFHVVKRAFQGIVISLSCAAFMHFIKPGDRKIVADRVALNPSYFNINSVYLEKDLDFILHMELLLVLHGISYMTLYFVPMNLRHILDMY